MGYFDKLAGVAFKEGETGETIYYPYGIMGKGRCISDPALKEKIFRFHRGMIAYLMPFSAIYGVTLGFSHFDLLAGLIPIFILTAGLMIWQYILIKDLPVSDIKLSFREAMTVASRAYSKTVIKILMINGVVLIALSVILLLLINKPLSQIAFIVFFPMTVGFLSIALNYYRLKLKQSDDYVVVEKAPEDWQWKKTPTPPRRKATVKSDKEKRQVNPKLVIVLVAVIALAIFVKVNNPYREYSTRDYWETATLTSVSDIPDAALKPGNRNGSVLMWAAMSTDNPKILDSLVERGADINESDGMFKGTPLSAAATYTSNPEIIDELIKLGANVDQLVNNGEDALMLCARYNNNPGVCEGLIDNGADFNRTNIFGHSALDIAIKNNNSAAIAALQAAVQKELNSSE
jgi:hypothetical protein